MLNVLQGDEGARGLAKALQINTKLQEILLDRNNITSKGWLALYQNKKKVLPCLGRIVELLLHCALNRIFATRL